MSMEEVKSQLLCMGYSEEEVEKIKELAIEVANTLAQFLNEVLERFIEIFSSCWDGIKDTLSELAEKLREWLDIPEEEKPDTKLYVPYNPPTGKEWYNQYNRKRMQDTRSTIKHFTIYKSGGKG